MKGEMKESDSSTSMMQSFETDSGVVWENKSFVSGGGRSFHPEQENASQGRVREDPRRVRCM